MNRSPVNLLTLLFQVSFHLRLQDHLSLPAISLVKQLVFEGTLLNRETVRGTIASQCEADSPGKHAKVKLVFIVNRFGWLKFQLKPDSF